MEEQEKTILTSSEVAKKNRFDKYADLGFVVQSAGISKEELVEFAKKTWKLTQDVLKTDLGTLDRITAFVNEVIESSGRGLEQFDAEKPLPIEDPEIPDGTPLDERIRAMRKFRDQLRREIRLQNSRTAMLAKIKDAVVYGAMLEGSDGQCTAIGAARWCENGFPQVTMGHKFCAALLASSTSLEATDFVKPPWSAFVIEVPNDLLIMYDSESGDPHEIRRILVMTLTTSAGEARWGYVAFTDCSLSLWRYGVTAKELSAPTEEGLVMSEGSQTFTEVDERLTFVLGRLIINTCLSMSDPTNMKKVGPGHKVYEDGLSHRMDPEPIVRTFQVGAPVKLDFREAIRGYIYKGASKMPSVQVLVCGHYKMQPYGPRHSLRKLLWIQPFWRGPADAPILVRPHELGSKSENKEVETG